MKERKELKPVGLFYQLGALVVFALPVIILSFLGYVKPEVALIQSLWTLVIVKYLDVTESKNVKNPSICIRI